MDTALKLEIFSMCERVSFFVLGHEMRVSFFTAHQESSLIGGFIICVGYGFSSYIIQVAEEDARWMRRGRYAYAGENLFFLFCNKIRWL